MREGFASSPLNRRVIGLSVPVVFGMLSHTVVWATDTAMVGVLGPGPLAASGLGGLMMHMCLGAMMGVGIGIQILVARRVGEKRAGTAGRVLLTSMTVSFAIGIVLTLVFWFHATPILAVIGTEPDVLELSSSYLSWRGLGLLFLFGTFVLRGFFDGIGKTHVGMFSSILTMVANVFLNWVLIYGNLGAPAYGLDGAGMASSLAALPGLVLFFFFFSRDMNMYFENVTARDFLRWPVIREVTKIGFPPAAENVAMNCAFLVFYKFAAIIGTVSIAATNIVITILSLSFLPGVAFGIAATTILGQAMGAGKITLARIAVYRSAFYSGVVMGVMGVIFVVAARPIISIFSGDPAVIEEAFIPLILVAIVQIPDAYNMVMTSAIRGAGLVYWVLCAIILIAFGLMLPSAYFFGLYLELGTSGLWIAIVVWIFATCIVFTTKFAYGDWKDVKV